MGTLRVSTRTDGDDVVVTVSDTGCGIPDDVRSRIFDPFFTTKEVGRGTGQGLAISRTIVNEKHGGSLTFESVLGEGTAFELRLPLARLDHAVITA
jgi:signal transduction histidine kinase